MDWLAFIRDQIQAQCYEISLHADDERLAEQLTVVENEVALMRGEVMETTFADCFYCGGLVTERTETREVRWHGELFLVEQVPMGVCTQCGERFLTPEVAKAIDNLLHTRKATRTAVVPVLTYTSDAA